MLIGGIVRRRQLRHVRAGLFAALPVHLAEQPHQRDGRRAGGQRAGHGQARRDRGQGRDWAEDEEEKFKAPIRERYEAEGNPYYATARLWDDGIIDPVQTRDVLGLAIQRRLNAPIPETAFGVFRM